MDQKDTDKPLEPGQQPPSVVRALKLLMRPLVRLLLSRGITYPIFVSWLKHIFVEVAENDFALPDKPQTDSRINLLTGIHRKDIKRLRNEPSDDETIPSTISLGALLVAKWTSLKEYIDADGLPVPLPKQAEENLPSFSHLVTTVSKDIRSRVVLDEWLRLGIVRMENDYVHLNTEAFVPEKGIDELAYYFGRNLRDHIAAASHNLSSNDSKFLERSVYYDQLSSESIEELQQLSEKYGMQALQSINKRAMVLQEQDTDKYHKRYRINFGIYFYHSKPDNSSEDN